MPALDLALLAEDCDQGLVGRAARHVGTIGEAFEDPQQILSRLLPRALSRFGVLGSGEQLRLRRLVAAAELLRQRGVQLVVVTPDLGEEPLDRHGHQLGATEAGHMRKDVGRVKPLAGDVEFQLLGQPGGHVLEDRDGQFVIAKHLLIAFDATSRDCDAGLEVEGVLDVAPEDVNLDGLLGGPAEEVGQEDQAGHRVQFLGGGAQFPTEILGQFANGHHFQEGMPKDPLPTLGDDPLTGRGYDALEGVEEAILSGVDHVDHNGRNSCFRIWLSL